MRVGGQVGLEGSGEVQGRAGWIVDTGFQRLQRSGFVPHAGDYRTSSRPPESTPTTSCQPTLGRERTEGDVPGGRTPRRLKPSCQGTQSTSWISLGWESKEKQ